jgi:hypothetical protein
MSEPAHDLGKLQHAAPFEPRRSALVVLFYVAAGLTVMGEMFLVLAQIATQGAVPADWFLWLVQTALALVGIGHMINMLECLAGATRG